MTRGPGVLLLFLCMKSTVYFVHELRGDSEISMPVGIQAQKNLGEKERFWGIRIRFDVLGLSFFSQLSVLTFAPNILFISFGLLNFLGFYDMEEMVPHVPT